MSQLVGLALPVDCAGCGLPDVALCRRCRAALCGDARRVALTAWPNGPPTWAGVEYRGPVRRVVLSWKESGRHDLTRVLADVLAVPLLRAPGVMTAAVSGATSVRVPSGACPERGAMGASRDESGMSEPRWAVAGAGRPDRESRGVVVVPVPSRRSARRARGEDLVLRVALRAAAVVRAHGGDVRVLPALHLLRTVADQAALGRAGRRANLHHAMAVRASARALVAGRRCVVVDDVLTTGITVREACRALRAAGAEPAGVAACCATPLSG